MAECCHRWGGGVPSTGKKNGGSLSHSPQLGLPLPEGCCKTGRLRFGGVLHPSYIRLTSVLHPSYIRLTSVLHASYIRLRLRKTGRLR